ncbi:hypothetical protein KPK_0614 [Klebsiella variicola]|uniref:Uncharacterized protein n=1 Tax=Klebsiella variicola (strain 342) TaxID=507522 RepID=B5XTZ0_KLEV3|nr:hypothetical protein KPK_0614 [Klebsiella variicola]
MALCLPGLQIGANRSPDKAQAAIRVLLGRRHTAEEKVG